MHISVTCDLLHAPEHVTALYERAFPANERRSFADMQQQFGDACELLVFEKDGQFIGFALLLTWLDLTHILYLAIGEAHRNCGFGAQALQAIRQHKPQARIIADLEDDAPEAANNADRVRRMQFYRRSGYEASAVRYVWRGEKYVMFISGGALTDEEFDAFWHHFSIQPQKPEVTDP